MMLQNTTIIALATPLGQAPLAVLRVSGPETFEITSQLFVSSKDFRQSAGHEIFFGYIKDPSTNKDVDQILLSVFKAPRSFTGEDMVEITCHGGTVLFQKILDLYLSLGATLAPRGEFSKRAFLNGKMDLTQVEAIHDLIFSRSFKTAQTVLQSLKKNFYDILQGVKSRILLLVSKIEVEIDYSEEYTGILDAEESLTLSEIIKEIDTLLEKAQRLQEYNRGHVVGIIGEPNAGKSSLLNILAGEQKAIVSKTAGTTRDAIEVSMNINDIPITFIDTAGLRENPQDDIERQGIQKSKNIMLTADFNLLVLDIKQFSAPVLEKYLREMKDQNIPFILVWNKKDLHPQFFPPAVFDNYPYILLSCTTGEGLDELFKILKDLSHSTDTGDGQVFLNQRQVSTLMSMRNLLAQALVHLQESDEQEMVSLLLQNSLRFIGEIDGSDVQESVLETIFSHFCIGK